MSRVNAGLIKSFPHLSTVDTDPKDRFVAKVPRSHSFLIGTRTDQGWTLAIRAYLDGSVNIISEGLSGDDFVNTVGIIIAYAKKHGFWR